MKSWLVCYNALRCFQLRNTSIWCLFWVYVMVCKSCCCRIYAADVFLNAAFQIQKYLVAYSVCYRKQVHFPVFVSVTTFLPDMRTLSMKNIDSVQRTGISPWLPMTSAVRGSIICGKRTLSSYHPYHIGNVILTISNQETLPFFNSYSSSTGWIEIASCTGWLYLLLSHSSHGTASNKIRNEHTWVENNPHTTVGRNFQHRFSVRADWTVFL